MRSITHPLSGAVYDLGDDGTVHVNDHGVTGVFTSHGVHIEGLLRHADPQLCLWIGGAQLPNRFQRAADAVSSGAST